MPKYVVMAERGNVVTWRLALLLPLAVGLAAGGAAYAEKGHAHSTNGGQVQSIGKFEGELVLKQGVATLYLVDEEEKKVDASKFSATASALAKGNEIKTIELRPSGENKLAGPVDFPIESKFRTTITLKSGDQDLGKARYNIDVK